MALLNSNSFGSQGSISQGSITQGSIYLLNSRIHYLISSYPLTRSNHLIKSRQWVRIMLLSMVCTLLPGLAFGQVDSKELLEMSLEELMNVTVTVATKTEKSVDEAPGTVRVITRQQIADMNARTLKEVLNVFVPGMDALPTSLKYGDRVETVFSRGINSDFSQQILYLFNGKNKFNETTFGQPLQFIEFTLENIERIEVSTSPLPIQGGSAITTINLITRDQTIEGVKANLNTGFNKNLAREGIQSYKFTTLFGQQVKGWHVGSSLQLYQDRGLPHPNPMGQGAFCGIPA